MPASNQKQSFYEILGIAKDADEETIRKAYKKLALKWHPDRNRDNQEEANKKFQEINKAYNVLSDQRKRQIYDQAGEEGLEGADGGPGFDPSEIFSRFFGGGGFGGGGFGGPGMFFGGHHQENKANMASPRKEVQLPIDIATCYKGGRQEVNVQRYEKCPDCEGRGVKSQDDIIKCPPCNGQGMTVQVSRTPFGMQQVHSQCNKCLGKGKSIRAGAECQKCIGRRVIINPKKYTVEIPPGAVDGHPIVFKGESDWAPDYGFNGDLIFIISVTTPPGVIFKREGFNLVIRKPISLVESLCGLQFGVRHLDDRILNIKWEKIIKQGDSLVVAGEGLPITQQTRQPPPATNQTKGDLIIRFDIVYPGETLDQQTRTNIRAILNQLPPHGQPKSMNINMTALQEQIRTNPVVRENVRVVEPEIRQEEAYQASSQNNNSSGPEFGGPDGFMFGGMPDGVQCAQQ